MGEHQFKKEDKTDFNLISIKGKKEFKPTSILDNKDNPLNQISSLLEEEDKVELNRGSSGLHITSNEFYTDKIKRLNNELDQSHKILSDFKKVIKLQRDEIERRKEIPTEQIHQLLNEKHKLISNIHEVTKELNEKYASRIENHNKELLELKQNNRSFEREKNKVLADLKQEIEKNKELELDFRHMLNEHKKDLEKREIIIKQLYEENAKFKKEAKEEAQKAKMYEKISLEAKNDAITFYEKFNDSLHLLKEEQLKNKKTDQKSFFIESELNKSQKQMQILKEEYENRIKKLKDKHEDEVRELISNQTKNEMVLKSQVYSLTQQYEDMEKKIAREKQKKLELADELKKKISSFISSPLLSEEDKDEMIFNVPKNLDDYDI